MLGEIKKIHKKIYNRIRVALDIYLTQFQKTCFQQLKSLPPIHPLQTRPWPPISQGKEKGQQ